MLSIESVYKLIEDRMIKNGEKITLIKAAKLFYKIDTLENFGREIKCSKERARQILYKIIRRARILPLELARINNEYFKMLQSSDERYFEVTEMLWIPFILEQTGHGKFKIINGYVISKDYFDFYNEKMRNNAIKDQLWIKEKFVYNGFIYPNVRMWIGKNSPPGEIISINDDLTSKISNIFRPTSIRALSARFEDWGEFIKVKNNNFMILEKWMQQETIELFPRIRKFLKENGTIKFDDLKEEVLSADQKERFPDDMLYYLLKRFSSFNFDSGNRKVISSGKIINVNKYLKSKFPKGYGEINIKELMDLGYSEFIAINNPKIFNSFYFDTNNYPLIEKVISRWINTQTSRVIFKKEFIEKLKGQNEALDFLMDNSEMFITILKNNTNLKISSSRGNIILEEIDNSVELDWDF